MKSFRSRLSTRSRGSSIRGVGEDAEISLRDICDTSMSSQVIVSPEKVYSTGLLEGIQRLWSTGDHSDVIILVGEKTFKCHKFMLAAVSTYFDAMFSSGMRESVSGEVTFPEMDPDLFDCVIKFVYSGDIELTIDNGVEILSIASVLQIKMLQQICEDFLYPHITSENCLKIWKLASFHDCHNLSNHAIKIVAANYQEIRKTSDFVELEGKELASIMKEDNLQIESEDRLCDTVFQWLEHDLEKRKKFCGNLFENIRLSFLNPEYLLTIEDRHDFLKDDLETMKYINEAKKYHLLPARQQDICNKQTRYRLSSGTEEVVVLLGGCESTTPPYIRSLQVICYSFQSKEWFELSALPYDPGIEFASCTYKNDIFVSGGGSMQNCLLRYDADKNKWVQMATMKSGRRRHSVVAVTGGLYALGGYDNKLEDGSRMLSSIELYDIREDEWSEVGQLPIAISSFSAAVVGESIYTFGGEKNDRKDTAFIQCFDTRMRQSCKLDAKIPMACKLTRSVAVNSRVFLIFYDGRVVEFCKDTKESRKTYCRTVGRLTAYQRIHFGVIHYQGNIIVLGGEIESNTLCKDLIMFDPSTSGCTTLSDTLPAPRLIDGCVKIAALKKHMKPLQK